MKNTLNILDKYRNDIDSIDKEIISLFSKRFSICKKIGVYKHTKGLPIFQKNRESTAIENIQNLSTKKGINAKFITRIYKLVFLQSRTLQRKKNIK